MRYVAAGLARSTGLNLFSSIAGELAVRTMRAGKNMLGAATTEFTRWGLFGYACQNRLPRLVCEYAKAPLLCCESLARTTTEFRALRAPGQLLFAIGIVSDARQLGVAINRSFRSRTMRPAAAQATRSLTNWSAVWAGAELFGTGGALLGIATGPGAAVTSGVGAVIGGYVGLVASEWLVRRIETAN
jgi:hypothetical protein